MKKVFYIHIPFCPSGCRFCHFYLEGTKKQGYIDLLKKEYKIRFSDSKLKVECIHIGGGTPNILSISELEDLLNFLNEKIYGFKEFSIELHPAFLSYELLDLLIKKGVNRISIGIQTLDSNILKNHTRVEVKYNRLGDYINYAKKIGFKKINFDFIYDLIGDNIDNMKKNLDFIEEYKPTSVYYYRLRKFTNFLKNNHKSSEKKAFLFYVYIKDFFKNIGYSRLNNSVYYDEQQLKGKNPFLYDEVIYSLKHELIGLGVAATSNIDNVYYKNSLEYNNYEGKIKKYKDSIDLKFSLPLDVYVFNKFYFYILQNHTFFLKDFLFEFSFGYNFNLIKKLGELKKYGIIEFSKGVIKLTEKGHYYIDGILGDIIFKGEEKYYDLLKKL